jgi:Ohr subfamily peroxiredoxin
MNALYSTQATALGGRIGSVASADGRLRLELSAPRALGGDGGAGTNPEQLLAAALASCLLEAIREAGGRECVRIAQNSNVTASVELADCGGDIPALRLSLSIDLPGIDGSTADRLVATAQANCPLVAAIRGGVDLKIWVD